MTKIQSKQIGNLYLSGLTDTNLTGLTDDNVIIYNSGTTKWEAVETIDITDTTLTSKFSISTAFTQDVTLTITHSLNTEDIIVQGWDGLNVLIGLDVQLNTGDTSNKINVTSSTSGTYKIVVVG